MVGGFTAAVGAEGNQRISPRDAETDVVSGGEPAEAHGRSCASIAISSLSCSLARQDPAYRFAIFAFSSGSRAIKAASSSSFCVCAFSSRGVSCRRDFAVVHCDGDQNRSRFFPSGSPSPHTSYSAGVRADVVDKLLQNWARERGSTPVVGFVEDQ